MLTNEFLIVKYLRYNFLDKEDGIHHDVLFCCKSEVNLAKVHVFVARRSSVNNTLIGQSFYRNTNCVW